MPRCRLVSPAGGASATIGGTRGGDCGAALAAGWWPRRRDPARRHPLSVLLPARAATVFPLAIAWQALLVLVLVLVLAPRSAVSVDFPLPGDFDALVGRHHHALVLVGLSRGCAKCNILLGELERVRLLRGAADLVAITAVDAREHKLGLRDFEVTAVPTLLWFSRAGGGSARAANVALQTGRGVVRRQRIRARGLPDPEPVSGHPLTADGIAAFLNEKLGPGKATTVGGSGGGGGGGGGAAADDGAASSAANGIDTGGSGGDGGGFVGVVLDDRTFHATVLNPDTFSLVLFCNGWHTECKAFRDTYAQVSRVFASDQRVIVAVVDMDEHQELAMNCGVVAVPTMQYYLQGTEDKEPHAYIHGSALGKITRFVRSKLRDVGWASGAAAATATLPSAAMRFPSVDDAIRHFLRLAEEFHHAHDAACGSVGQTTATECHARLAPPQAALDAAEQIGEAAAAGEGACVAAARVRPRGDAGGLGDGHGARDAEAAAAAMTCGGLKKGLPPAVREVYRKIARRVLTKGLGYLHTERKRVQRVLDTGALSDLVRDALTVKLKVLEVFASL